MSQQNPFEEEIFTLTDEEGNESKFALLATHELSGVTYVALEPMEDNENGEYVVLRLDYDAENDEELLVTIDDDDEFDDVADYFDDMLSDEADYDLNNDGE